MEEQTRGGLMGLPGIGKQNRLYERIKGRGKRNKKESLGGEREGRWG